MQHHLPFVWYVKMGTKITASELSFSCKAAPKMIQYSVNWGIILRNVTWTVPVAAGAVLDFYGTFAIMYLTRQPIR